MVCSCFWFKNKQAIKKLKKAEYYLHVTFNASWSSQNIDNALLALLSAIFLQPACMAFYGGRFTQMSWTLIATGIRTQFNGTVCCENEPRLCCERCPQAHRTEALYRGKQEEKDRPLLWSFCRILFYRASLHDTAYNARQVARAKLFMCGNYIYSLSGSLTWA